MIDDDYITHAKNGGVAVVAQHLTHEELETYQEWINKQNSALLKAQMAKPVADGSLPLMRECHRNLIPYLGPLCMGVAFTMVVTSQGVLVSAKHVFTGDEIILTDPNTLE